MRVGYGAFPSGLIDYMWRAKQPYNVTVASEVAARAALTNPTYLNKVPRVQPSPHLVCPLHRTWWRRSPTAPQHQQVVFQQCYITVRSGPVLCCAL